MIKFFLQYRELASNKFYSAVACADWRYESYDFTSTQCIVLQKFFSDNVLVPSIKKTRATCGIFINYLWLINSFLSSTFSFVARKKAACANRMADDGYSIRQPHALYFHKAHCLNQWERLLGWHFIINPKYGLDKSHYAQFQNNSKRSILLSIRWQNIFQFCKNFQCYWKSASRS